MPKQKKKQSSSSNASKRPRAEGEQFKFLSLESGADVNKDVSLSFELKSREDEAVRFGENPLFIKYKVRYKNPAYKDGADATIAEHIYLTGARKDLVAASGAGANAISAQNVHLPPLLGPATFFNDMEVKIDNQDVNERVKLESFNRIYTAWDKVFMTKDEYKKTYHEDRVMISTEGENQLSSPVWQQAAKAMDFGSSLRDQSMSILERFNIHGTFPLSPFSNVLSALRKKENTRNWFAPLSEFHFRITKRQPIDEAVERVGHYTDAQYFTGDMPAAVEWHDLELVIEDLRIMYESVKIKQLPGARASLGTFEVDVPIVVMAHLPSGQMQTVTKVEIPAGTKAVMIGFPVEDQLYFNKTSKKFLRSGVIFPPDLKELKIDLAQREDLIFKTGFKNLGIPPNQDDLTCRAYYEELVRQKLYDGSLDSLFGRSATHPARYNSVIVLNILSSHLKQAQPMTLTAQFGPKMSPAKTKILIFCLTTWKYSISNNHRFTYSQIL
jgi:hypothetical protein